MPIIVPLLLAGVGATAGGLLLQEGERRRAEKRANAEFEVLQKNQKRLREERQENLDKQIETFGSEEREELRQEGIAEDTEALGSTLARDRTALTDPSAGNVSNVFLNKKAALSGELDERGQRKAGLLAKVRGPGQANFKERKRLTEGTQRGNTLGLIARNLLNADERAVAAAAVPRSNLLADVLIAGGPALATAGLLGGLGGAGAAGKIGSAATTQSIAAPAAAVNTAIGGGATLPSLKGLGDALLLGGVSSLNNPRRRFSRAA